MLAGNELSRYCGITMKPQRRLLPKANGGRLREARTVAATLPAAAWQPAK
jgi:hypothetical protein